MDYIHYLQKLRNNVVKRDTSGELKILLASFEGTTQEKDIFIPIIDRYFRRKINVKCFDETYMQKKGKHAIDFSNNEAVLNGLREDFDMSLWGFFGIGKGKFIDYNTPFIYQLKGCNFHCPYCYVDDKNKNAKESGGSRFFSIPKIIDAFEEYKKKTPLYIIRPSGGEPTLAVEQWLELVREIKKRGENDIYIRSDTNLSTGHFIEHLETIGEIEKNLLEKVADSDGFGLLCSFKGTDVESFVKNTSAPKELFEEQFYSFKKYVKAGIDSYPFIYNPNPASLESFMERLASEVSENVYLKTWIFPLKLYGPEKERLEKKGINPKDYQRELDENFSQSKEKMQEIIWKKYGINYQAFMRTGIKLEVKK